MHPFPCTQYANTHAHAIFTASSSIGAKTDANTRTHTQHNDRTRADCVENPASWQCVTAHVRPLRHPKQHTLSCVTRPLHETHHSTISNRDVDEGTRTRGRSASFDCQALTDLIFHTKCARAMHFKTNTVTRTQTRSACSRAMLGAPTCMNERRETNATVDGGVVAAAGVQRSAALWRYVCVCLRAFLDNGGITATRTRHTLGGSAHSRAYTAYARTASQSRQRSDSKPASQPSHRRERFVCVR